MEGRVLQCGAVGPDVSGPCVSPDSRQVRAAMDALTLTAIPRTVTGKKVKALRRDGVVPIHMFGRGIESQSLQAEERVLGVVLPQAGTNVPITIDVDGEDSENVCFVRQVQRHPVSEALLHVDFQRPRGRVTRRAGDGRHAAAGAGLDQRRGAAHEHASILHSRHLRAG